MGPSLGSLIRQADQRIKEQVFDAQPASAKYEKYLGVLENESLMKRWHEGAQSSSKSTACRTWAGPTELFVKTDQKDIRYSPFKILLQYVAGSKVRPERVVPTCSQDKCFNASHYSVISLRELNDANFESNIAIGADARECSNWVGHKNFTVLHNWSSRSVTPQKYLFARIFPDMRLQRLAFMACSNSLCVNPAHIDRRPTSEESSESRTVAFLESVFAVLDRPGHREELELGCVELTDEELSELAPLFGPETPSYTQIRANELDWIFRVAWHCLAATAWSNYRFFAFPSGFRNLGEVSASMRRGFECPKSSRCYTPSHRLLYLQKALKRNANPGNRNESTLHHSIGLTESTLLRSLAK